MNKTTNATARIAGFSLVELMVVMVILTIGLLPLALVQTRASQDVTESGQFSEAVRVAELQMESAKSLGFGNIPADSGTAGGGIYTWDRQIGNVSLGLDQITVNVRWKEKGDPRTVQVVNMISFR